MRSNSIIYISHLFIVQFIAVAVCMQKCTHQHFGLCVFALYLLHIKAPLLRCVYVGHGYKATFYVPDICKVAIAWQVRWFSIKHGMLACIGSTKNARFAIKQNYFTQKGFK